MDIDLPFFDDSDDDDEAEGNCVGGAPSVSKTFLSKGFDHIRCIINNKIQFIGDHPLTGMIARTLEKHADVVMNIVLIATKKAVDDIDSDWVRKQLELARFRAKDWNMIYNCRSYLLEFARYAALESQVQKVSDTLLARQCRMLRVDEIDTNGHERGPKRPHFKCEISDDEDEEYDPYFKDFSCDDPIFLEELSNNAPETFPTDDSANYSVNELKEETRALSSEQSYQEDMTMTRRHQLRAQLSSDIGFVSALGKGTKQIQSAINHDKSGAERCVMEGRDYSVQQRKKRTPVKNLNAKIRRHQLDNSVIHAAIKTQKEVVQNAISGRTYERFCTSPITHGLNVNSRFESTIYITEAQQPATKSCLKKTKREKAKGHIKFSGETNFDKTATGIYVDQNNSRKRTGQYRTNFISLSFDSLSIDSSEIDNANGICLPNCDTLIKPAIRYNPILLGNKLPKIKEAITNDFYRIMKRALYLKSVKADSQQLPPMLVSRLLLTDSMLSSLEEDIFRNMDLMKLDYPRMPEWFLEALDRWFSDDELTFVNGGVFLYSKIFISLGLDLLFYYADPKGDEIEVHLKFLQGLAEWFKTKVEHIRKFVYQREKGTLQQKRHPKFELLYKKPLEKNGEFEIVPQFKIVQIPTFVIITTPEIGGWRRYFTQLNKRLREFVKEPMNSHFFDLLDWAEMVKSAPPESANTVSKRAALLVNAMYEEHGVFYV